MKKIILTSALALSLASVTAAQGVREINSTPANSNKTETAASPAKPSSPAPKSFAAKYEGGLFGFSEKQKGTMHFDDANKRLVFRNKENKEVFALPYKSLLVIYPSSRSVTPTAARVAGAAPILGAGLANLIKKKNRYLVVQFADPDSEANGTANFKLDNKEVLQSVIFALGEKADMKQRGDAFYRPKKNEMTTL
jgi:hypothetical protein